MTKPILHVEDEENDVLLLKLAFQQVGISNPVRVVRTGRQALDYLRGEGKYAEREEYPLPCLVLLDLKLPQMSGLDVLKWMRREPAFRTTIVVVFTSSSLDRDVEEAYRFGANSYLVKPASAGELVPLVQLVQQYWLGVNLPPPECLEDGEDAALHP